MAVHFNCKCPERKKHARDRNWFVTQRHCHHSAFSGYRRTPSEYSTVLCEGCGAVGRTKAGYVALLPDWRGE